MTYTVAHPFAYYATLSAAMIVCLYLFVSTERKLHLTRRRLQRQVDELGRESTATIGQVASIETRFGQWADRTKDLEERVAGLASVRRPQAMTTGVDANQRAQVLRMARRGDRADQIAAELRIPKSEVDLLVKVQRAVVRAF